MAGELVASFGDGGTLDLPLRPFSVFTQHDGRFIVTRNNSAATGPYIERFLPDGTPDASFNSELLGQIQARIGWMEKVTMDAADRLLISSGAGLARVTPGGRLDKSFGKTGRARSRSSTAARSSRPARSTAAMTTSGSTTT